MKKENEKENKNENTDVVKHNQNQEKDSMLGKSEKIDPMGTEVMQEDDYQKRKHGKLPEDDQSTTT